MIPCTNLVDCAENLNLRGICNLLEWKRLFLSHCVTYIFCIYRHVKIVDRYACMLVRVGEQLRFSIQA